MSITRDQLIQFIEKPGLLKEQTIGDLKEIVDEFPYFQSAQLLYTCNLNSSDNFRYSGYLKICSVYATDRTILYQLIKQPRVPVKIAEKSASQSKIVDLDTSPLFELSEENQITEAELRSFTASQSDEAEFAGLDLLSFEQPEIVYSIEEYELSADSETQATESNDASTAEKKVDLIEQFIKESPVIQPRMENIPEQMELSEVKEEADTETDEYITETLSRIYLKQGHYQKAIDSFQRLSLKFPEKSIYFAHQIEEIKKLLN